jgi:hypothetical protein
MTPPVDSKIVEISTYLHLSSDQMSDLLACALSPRGQNAGEDLDIDAAAIASAEAHLLTCAACAAELASLRETFELFREASIAHADREFSQLRIQRPAFRALPTGRAMPQGLVWLAASAILVAGMLPLEMRWQRNTAEPPSVAAGTPAHSAESDEALLEDINNDLSASVPAPMQALADPTGDSASGQAMDADPNSSPGRRE